MVWPRTDIPTVRRFGERVADSFLRNPREWKVRGGPRSMGIEGAALDVLRQIDALVAYHAPSKRSRSDQSGPLGSGLRHAR